MSERDGYQPGVPCWVDTRQPDPQAATDFYVMIGRTAILADPQGATFSVGRVVSA